MYLAQRIHFLQDVFQMTAILLVSVIKHYNIDGLHLFWDSVFPLDRNTWNVRTIAKLHAVSIDIWTMWLLTLQIIMCCFFVSDLTIVYYNNY